MDWTHWPHVSFHNRSRLPEIPGIYVIADINQFVWYVGQAKNLRSRWTGKTHHRYPQLIRSHKKLQHKIYWTPISEENLDAAEQKYIHLFRPELNDSKVKNYLPKEASNRREIRRILKAINRETLLFPKMRSLVLGEYTDENDVLCILIAANINDAEILAKSVNKRRSREVRRAWGGYDCQCDLQDTDYNPASLLVYRVGPYRLEFLFLPEFLRFIEDNWQTYSNKIVKRELFSAEARVLEDLSVLDQFPFSEMRTFQRSDGKKDISDGMYLTYRHQVLSVLSASWQL
ncbi:MAG: GIY-YIG nuclease family protein [Cyanobacteria bacterium P01_F01_bin.42]